MTSENRIVSGSSVIKALFGFTLFFLGILHPAGAQDALSVIGGESSNNSWLHFSDAPNSLYHHLTGQAYERLDQRSGNLRSLQSRTDWEQRQQQVRQKLMETIGPFPEKTPLNAAITRTIEKDTYRVEHIVFESQPEFYVTSSLYIPDGVDLPAPAVIYVSGHTQDGYRANAYQHKILNLVNKGFIVFAFDPVSQGERLEYYDSETGDSVVGGPTREHSYSGVQAFINGSSLARYMTWDGIRAVDYLLTRSEIDSERIGITGRSGGGTQTAYIAAIDDRIHAAAPEAYITTFTRLLQSIGPQDAEQNLYHGIARGIDHADFLTVRAPKPTLLIATTEDFFSIQGARETADEVSGIYEAYGEPDYFSMAEDGGGHQSTQNNREAMYAFFQLHLNNPGDPADEDVELLTDDELRVTSTGQVSSSLGGETVFSLNRAEAEKKAEELQNKRGNYSDHLSDIVQKAKELSGYREPETASSPVFTGRIKRDGYVIEKYFVQGEGDYIIPYLLMVPDEPSQKALVYLHPESKAAEAAENGEMEWFARNGFTVLAPDLIGIGEMGSGDVENYSTRVKHFNPVSFDVWIASVLIGRSVTGIQAGDVVKLSRLLREKEGIDEVYGAARKQMSAVLLHAAAFDETISRVALIEPYLSYRSMVMNRYYDPGLHISAVAGSIGVYDLPDLAASLAPRRLLMTGITDGTGRWAESQDDENDISAIQTAYDAENSTDQLTIIPGQEDFLNWVE
jgi:hypothetical protein